jgi:hypothetical protein
MKVVNIPSTKMMKKFNAHLRANLASLRVPMHAIVLKHSVIIAIAAKQSFARHNGWMDYFAALEMTAPTPAPKCEMPATSSAGITSYSSIVSA